MLVRPQKIRFGAANKVIKGQVSELRLGLKHLKRAQNVQIMRMFATML